MKKELSPEWSAEQKAAGERARQAWEEFFSAEKEIPEPPHVKGLRETEVVEILARHETKLLRYPNVIGVAPGIRTKRGKPTGERCVTVYVERKIPRGDLGDGEILPREIEGIPVDVVEVGKVEVL